jgi:hypothetical protein
LSDADKLDVIGAIGIVRSCCWLGENMAKIWSALPLEVYNKENLTKEKKNQRQVKTRFKP